MNDFLTVTSNAQGKNVSCSVVQRSKAVKGLGGWVCGSDKAELSILRAATTLSGSFLICKTEEDPPCKGC